MCDEIFTDPPVRFTPQKGNKTEELLAKMIKKHKVTLPIIHVRQNLYLIGSQKVSMDFKFNSIMVRPVNSGGMFSAQERFETYITKNHRKFERKLVNYMSGSQDSLQTVLDKLKSGDKIRKV